MKSKQLIIYGTGETADIAYQYFTHDSDYQVIGFVVDAAYRERDNLNGLPVIDFENLPGLFPPETVEVFIAISYTKLNRVRAKFYQRVKELGYQCASYISSRAFVWHNVKIGENCMIFENNVIQHKAKLGNGVILWSGNHIGHQSEIGDFSYVSSHVVISGFCKVGNYSFLGVNSTLNDSVVIGTDTLLASGALVTKSFPGKGNLLLGSPAKKGPVSSYTTIGLSEEEINIGNDLG